MKKLINEEAITDGRKGGYLGEYRNPKDVDAAIEAGATGIGLYRTEFLFMDSARFPTEQEQYEAYRVVAEKIEWKACDYKNYGYRWGQGTALFRFA